MKTKSSNVKTLVIASVILSLFSLVLHGFNMIDTSVLTDVYPPDSVQVEFKDGVALEEEKIYPFKIKFKYKEITTISKYIRERVSKTPIELCDAIAYSIVTLCKKKGMPIDLVVGIIEVESMWDPTATSGKNAKGLMQILREDGVEILEERAYDISYNILKGIEIFQSKLEKANGDMSLALSMYVGGSEKYISAVYKSMGRYMTYKMNNSTFNLQTKITVKEPYDKTQ